MTVSLRLCAVFALAGACTTQVPDRDPADRTPLSAPCDTTDLTRCLLPWPSNTYTVADATTETGLRLDIQPDSLPVEDRLEYLNIADGFSRATGLAIGIEGSIHADVLSWDPADSLEEDAPVQVFVAQPDHPQYGQRVPFRTEDRDASDDADERHLIVARPIQPLDPATDYVFIATRTLSDAPVPKDVQTALGLSRPRNEAGRALAAYHAPTRAVLETAGVDPESVLRVSTFTTRSHTDTTRRIRHMMEVLNASPETFGVEIDTVTFTGSEHVAFVLRGRLTDAPSFLTEEGYLALDDDGLPTVTGTAAIEFRLTVPAGEGDYRFALYGHGTGGNVTDDSFDREMAEYGIGKLNLRYDGWTDEDFVATLLSFATFLEGSERSTAGLMQALAGGTALLTAMDGVLGDVLSGETLAGEPNPAAGRHPITSDVAWVGGSMGGTMGAVIVSADERLKTAVLNVPGAGWTHLIPYSLLYNSGMGGIMETTYGDRLSIQLGMLMSQTSWDDVDGAVWADEALEAGGAFLLQESMDDPVLPNLGTELLANALGAVQLEPSLQTVHGLESSTEPISNGASLTQFRVPNTGPYDVHGFAARATPAGDAALGQILEFLDTAWNAEAPVMRFPVGCSVTADENCDFSGMWED